MDMIRHYDDRIDDKGVLGHHLPESLSQPVDVGNFDKMRESFPRNNGKEITAARLISTNIGSYRPMGHTVGRIKRSGSGGVASDSIDKSAGSAALEPAYEFSGKREKCFPASTNSAVRLVCIGQLLSR